jgi:hypothetical protein
MCAFVLQQRRSNWTQVVLRRVMPALSGRYSCEVSADAPSFHTALVSGDMNVVGESKLIVYYHSPTVDGHAPLSCLAVRHNPEI